MLCLGASKQIDFHIWGPATNHSKLNYRQPYGTPLVIKIACLSCTQISEAMDSGLDGDSIDSRPMYSIYRDSISEGTWVF